MFFIPASKDMTSHKKAQKVQNIFSGAFVPFCGYP